MKEREGEERGGRERGEGNEGRGRGLRLGELVSHHINTQSSTPLSHTHSKF